MNDIDRQGPLPPALAEAVDLARRDGGRDSPGSRVLYYPVASSTNDLAARAAERGAPDGTLVIAGQQVAGRGRAGHQWYSPAGAGLYLSVVVDTRAGEVRDRVGALTLAAGVGVAEGLHAASGLPVRIKWPNDLVMAPAGTVRGARKLAGILAEGQVEGEDLTRVVVGIGVNVGAAPWPAEISAKTTSLEEELGRPVDPALVLGALLSRFGAWLRRGREGDTAAVSARWQRLGVGASGATVEIPLPGGVRRGVTCGLDADGALLVRHGAEIERVVGGEVTWL